MDFDPFLPPFWPLSDPDFGPFRAHFGSILCSFLGPLRGPILSENITKPKRFGVFRPSKLALFLAHFGAHFGPVLRSILGHFWGPFWEAGRTPFPIVFGLAWPASGAEVERFPPPSP